MKKKLQQRLPFHITFKQNIKNLYIQIFAKKQTILFKIYIQKTKKENNQYSVIDFFKRYIIPFLILIYIIHE